MVCVVRLRALSWPIGIAAGAAIYATLWALTGERIVPGLQAFVLTGLVQAELAEFRTDRPAETGPLVTRPAFQRRALGLLLLSAGTMFLLTSALAEQVGVQDARDWIRDLGPWGPLLLIVVLASAMLFSPIPNVPFFIAAGLAWGTPLGTLYSVLGQVLGATCAFWVSRKLGRKHLPRLVGERAASQVDRLSKRLGPQVIFWARMIPVVSFDLASYAAGLTAMRYLPFVIAAALGSIIPTAVVAHFGESLDGSLEGLLVSIVLVVAAVVLPTTIWAIRNRSTLPRMSEWPDAVRKALAPPDVNSV